MMRLRCDVLGGVTRRRVDMDSSPSLTFASLPIITLNARPLRSYMHTDFFLSAALPLSPSSSFLSSSACYLFFNTLRNHAPLRTTNIIIASECPPLSCSSSTSVNFHLFSSVKVGGPLVVCVVCVSTAFVSDTPCLPATTQRNSTSRSDIRISFATFFSYKLLFAVHFAAVHTHTHSSSPLPLHPLSRHHGREAVKGLLAGR